jgi:hypothetical protein
MPEPEESSNKIVQVIIGVVLVAAAVVSFVVYRDSRVSCQIGAFGVEFIANGVTHGRSADDITASQFVPEVCESVINTLIANPQEEVTFNLELPAGGIIEQTVPGTQVLRPPPPAPPGSAERIVQCLAWESSILYRLCVDGRLFTPSN